MAQRYTRLSSPPGREQHPQARVELTEQCRRLTRWPAGRAGFARRAASSAPPAWHDRGLTSARDSGVVDRSVLLAGDDVVVICSRAGCSAAIAATAAGTRLATVGYGDINLASAPDWLKLYDMGLMATSALLVASVLALITDALVSTRSTAPSGAFLGRSETTARPARGSSPARPSCPASGRRRVRATATPIAPSCGQRAAPRPGSARARARRPLAPAGGPRHRGGRGDLGGRHARGLRGPGLAGRAGGTAPRRHRRRQRLQR
jgi:hypothetical protein